MHNFKKFILFMKGFDLLWQVYSTKSSTKSTPKQRTSKMKMPENLEKLLKTCRLNQKLWLKKQEKLNK